MSAKITSGLFYDGFTGDAGGGAPFMNGNNVDRMKRVTIIQFAWDLKNAAFNFANVDGAGVLTMTNPYDNRTFVSQEFKNTDTFQVVGGNPANEKVFTISKISDDGKSAIMTDAFDVETDSDDVSLFGTTPITALDFYYNLVPNNTGENFTSIVDPFSQQKFSITGILASNTTPQSFAIGTKSFAWVTEKITDTVNGKTNAVFIEGLGISDYVQSFKVTQYFTITPFSLNSQQANFEKIIPPDYYFAGKSLKYICRADGKYLAGNALPDHSVVDLGINGTGTWLNQAALGAKGEYSIASVVFTDNDTSESLERLDIARNCKVVISINSRSGKFQTSGSDEDSTQFILGFNTRPSDEDEYQDTDTTQRDNFFQDSCTNFLDGILENGLQYGTARQSIVACKCDYVSATVATITFVFTAGSLLVSYWKSKTDSDRNYEINLITQDVLCTTTLGNDRMTLLVDKQSADWTRIDSSLFKFTGNGLRGYKYPDMGLFARGSLEGFQGEAFFVDMGFAVQQHLGEIDNCTVQNITWQVVGTKSGQSDFIFERQIIDFTQAKKLLSVQQLTFVDERGFIIANDSPFNSVAVIRDAANDDSENSAWLAYYPLILRFESWVEALQQFYSSDTSINDIQKFIDEITQDWTSYDNVEGWNLKLRFSCSILNLDLNSTNIYQTQIPIVAKKISGVAIWSGATGSLKQVTKYYNEDATEEIASVDRNGITLIRTTLTGNFPLAEGENYCGAMMATVEDGNIFDRRIASTEIESESTSPFSPTDSDSQTGYDFTWTNGGCRIFVFTGVKIITESYFDSSIYNQLKKNIVVQSIITTTPIIES